VKPNTTVTQLFPTQKDKVMIEENIYLEHLGKVRQQ